MRSRDSKTERRIKSLMRIAPIAMLGMMTGSASGQFLPNFYFFPGNLIVSRSVYDNRANNVQVGQDLPPNCTAGNCMQAVANGIYPQVWNNDAPDGSFGITSKIFLDQITPSGFPLGSLEVPNSSERINPRADHLVTSFSSKSELALNLSLDRKYVTFMGYVAPIDAIDLSNSNTPLAPDPTNPVNETALRAVAEVDRFGRFHFTETDAYSGNNGRAAILNDDANVIYTAGNAGNGSNPQSVNVVLGAGAQFITPSVLPEFNQNPALPTPLASFSVTELGAKPDKIGKDDNFRGLTVYNNVVYYTKGSGGNGVNTVYFVDTTATACPKGIGLPAPGATLPTTPLSFNLASVAANGLPNNMCILSGFPSVLNSKAAVTAFPFGIWFANSTTLYVADEGDGTLADAGSDTSAGLQKWVFNSAKSQWQLAYVLSAGLGLGVSYTVPRYPAGNNPATGIPWAPETDGLRNITGTVDSKGNATIYAITSTVSGNGDQGADPNRLVAITDDVTATTLPTAEKFKVIRSAGFGEVLRGVSFAPDQGSLF